MSTSHRGGIVLRRLTEADWREWRELRLDALAEAPDAFGATLADWSESGDREERWRGRLITIPLNVIAHRGGRPVGMVGGSGPIGGEAELISMWVVPEARGTGVGVALIDETCRWAIDQGAVAVGLWVREDNQHAINLYRGCGFVDTGRTAETGVPGLPEKRMLRQLQVP
jgi:ribosomal protein S18 acetylase RimI-like enzyme